MSKLPLILAHFPDSISQQHPAATPGSRGSPPGSDVPSVCHTWCEQERMAFGGNSLYSPRISVHLAAFPGSVDDMRTELRQILRHSSSVTLRTHCQRKEGN